MARRFAVRPPLNPYPLQAGQTERERYRHSRERARQFRSWSHPFGYLSIVIYTFSATSAHYRHRDKNGRQHTLIAVYTYRIFLALLRLCIVSQTHAHLFSLLLAYFVRGTYVTNEIDRYALFPFY